MTTPKIIISGQHRALVKKSNGDLFEGDIIDFTPGEETISMEIINRTVVLNQNDLVFIAFKGNVYKIGADNNEGFVFNKFKVSCVDGEVFDVITDITSTDPSNFFGYSIDGSNDYEELWFHKSGVLKIEPLDNSYTVPDTASDDTVRRGKLRIGSLLIEDGLISEDQLEIALAEQRVEGHKLGEVLVKSGAITEDELLRTLSIKFNIPLGKPNDLDISDLIISEMGLEFFEKNQCLPLKSEGSTLCLAVSEPLSESTRDKIKILSGGDVRETLFPVQDLQAEFKILETASSLGPPELDEEYLYKEVLQSEKQQSEHEITASASDAPIIRLVNRLIHNGLRKKASDIHIKPQERKLSVAYRLNGELIGEAVLDKKLNRQIAARIKILCGMDIAERRMPQDGRLVLGDKHRTYEFRVSCIPNTFGESMVLRVLDKDMAVDLDSIGFIDKDQKSLAEMARKPYGLILVTGPTGSGKSTTLFSLLKTLSSLPANIITIEDPVESIIEVANQIQVNNKIGLTFARILRQVLRHDPDIVMVGEMRDKETAEIGVEAALTGHLMLSTLHTNSAVDTIIRLNDLGIPNYLIAPSLLGILSQNLLKKLCPHCKIEVPPSSHSFEAISKLGFGTPEKLYEKKPGGCSKCNNSGYSGRTVTYEFLEITEPIRAAIHAGVNGKDLEAICIQEGMVKKAKRSFDLVAKGIIDHKDFLHSLF